MIDFPHHVKDSKSSKKTRLDRENDNTLSSAPSERTRKKKVSDRDTSNDSASSGTERVFSFIPTNQKLRNTRLLDPISQRVKSSANSKQKGDGNIT
jgi:uncharacterized protein (DUF1015 family)